MRITAVRGLGDGAAQETTRGVAALWRLPAPQWSNVMLPGQISTQDPVPAVQLSWPNVPASAVPAAHVVYAAAKWGAPVGLGLGLVLGGVLGFFLRGSK